MQIFVLHPHPNTAADLLCYKDFKRFNKQILEMAQLLAVSFPELEIKRKDGGLYSTNHHKNHPCVPWVKANPEWSVWFMIGLLQSYRDRTGKQHGCESVLSANLPKDLDKEPEFVYFSKVDVPGDTVFEKYDRLLELKNFKEVPIRHITTQGESDVGIL
jgi:hypothetical protein